MPMVAMKRMMSGWFTSGRSNHALDGGGQRQHDEERQREGKPGRHAAFVEPDSVSAAKTTMMPCAKLKMREDLKISTKPSAISA